MDKMADSIFNMIRSLFSEKMTKPGENHPDSGDYNRAVSGNQAFFEYFLYPDIMLPTVKVTINSLTNTVEF